LVLAVQRYRAILLGNEWEAREEDACQQRRGKRRPCSFSLLVCRKPVAERHPLLHTKTRLKEDQELAPQTASGKTCPRRGDGPRVLLLPNFSSFSSLQAKMLDM
jgi:hypothetical protein